MVGDASGRLNGEAMEIVAALDEGMEVCFASYALMAVTTEDPSFSRKPVARVGKPGMVLEMTARNEEKADFLAYELVVDPFPQVYESPLGDCQFLLPPLTLSCESLFLLTQVP